MTLKPCPFAHDPRERQTCLRLVRSSSPHVSCVVYGVDGPWVDVDDFDSQEAAEAKAVELWNARAVEPATATKGN